MKVERLREVLDYDPVSGQFRWKVQLSPRGSSGSLAGSQRPSGYIQISVDGEQHYAHRLAWMYVTGSFPKEHVDHVDGKRSNNAFKNLRECNRRENGQNRSSASVKGCTWDKQKGKFRAQIGVDGKIVNLGLHSTMEDAQSAYASAKRELHTFNPRLRT